MKKSVDPKRSEAARSLPPKRRKQQIRFGILTKWNGEEQYYLDLLASRRGMNRSKYLRWLVGEARKNISPNMSCNR